MTLIDEFKTIKKLNDDLGKSLGIRTIDVKQESHKEDVEVVRYVKCLNPFDEVVFIKEDRLDWYINVGLSLRRC